MSKKYISDGNLILSYFLYGLGLMLDFTATMLGYFKYGSYFKYIELNKLAVYSIEKFGIPIFPVLAFLIMGILILNIKSENVKLCLFTSCLILGIGHIIGFVSWIYLGLIP